MKKQQQQPPELKLAVAPTALVVQRLSIVPEGEQRTALERIDGYVASLPAFLEGAAMILEGAQTFEVHDDTSAQTADIIQDELKAELKDWDNRRLSVTRPIDDLKTYIVGLPKPGMEPRLKAIQVYQGKIGAYRTKKRQEELAAQREAERLLREEKERLEAAARKRDEDAQRLKTKAAQDRAAADAERLREQAAFVPESVAIASSGESLSASTAALVWEGSIPLCDACQAADQKRPDPKRRCIHNEKLALQTILSKHDEWWEVISFAPAGLNAMSRKYRDTLELPGLKFEGRESFRAKPRR